MRDQYIPDMTERFPEGLDGIDLTDNYFPDGSSLDRDLAWSEMDNEYNEYLKDTAADIQAYSDEELQQMYDELLGNLGDKINSEDFNETAEYELMKAIQDEWDRRSSEREAADKQYFIAWYNSGNDKDDYEIYQASDLDEALSLATADLGDALVDVENYQP